MSVRRPLSWHIGISAYWFATSFKWFILLLATLPAQIEKIVPEGTNNSAWGQVVMIGATWAIIGPSLFGWLSDRTRSRFGARRLFIAIGAGLSLIALFTLFGAKSLTMMIVGYLLLQISDDVGTGPYSALIPESVDAEDRAHASGILGQMRLLAQICSGVLGFLVADLAGVYIGIALVNVIGALWTIWTLRNVPEPERNPEPITAKGFFSNWVSAFRNRDFTLVFIVTFVGNLGYYIVQTFIRNFFADRITDYRVFGISLGVKDPSMAVYLIGLLISLVGIGGALWAAKRSDRFGRKKSVFLGGTLMAIPLIPFAFIHNFSVIFALAPIFAFGYGIYTAASWALVSDILPNESTYGRDMGVWQAAWSSVQIPAGLIGYMIDGLNKNQAGMGYTAMFLVGSALMVIGASATKFVKGST